MQGETKKKKQNQHVIKGTVHLARDSLFSFPNLSFLFLLTHNFVQPQTQHEYRLLHPLYPHRFFIHFFVHLLVYLFMEYGRTSRCWNTLIVLARSLAQSATLKFLHKAQQLLLPQKWFHHSWVVKPPSQMDQLTSHFWV